MWRLGVMVLAVAMVSIRLDYLYIASPTGRNTQKGLNSGYNLFEGIGLTGTHAVSNQFCADCILKNPALMPGEISPGQSDSNMC